MADFKPSNVVLARPPLVATMGRAELEAGAALIVRTLQRNGDTWRVVTMDEVVQAIDADIAENVEPIASLNRNPFLRPDVRGLAKDGFAVVTDTTVELTDKGLEALRRWVKQHKEGA